MLYPKENEVRMISDLSGIWEFKLGDEREPGEECKELSHMEPIAVPASYNDQKDERAYREHYGWAYYRKSFAVPKCWQGQRVVLRFDAVTHRAKVYLDGRLMTEHQGGFLPFELDITESAPAGSRTELVVAVDNRVSHSTLPVGNEGSTAFFGSDNPGVPAVEAAKAWTKPRNLPNFDFFNYAGINRPVRLYTTPQTYIKDITLVPDLCGQDGIVKYQIQIREAREEKQDNGNKAGTENTGIGNPGTEGAEKQAAGRQQTRAEEGTETAFPLVHVDILDDKGCVIAGADGESGQITIPEARLWWPWPGEPYLYTAVVTCGEDRYEQAFGIRTVRVEGTQFLINGKPFYFKGFGKHEDSAFHGRGLDLCLNVKIGRAHV